MNVYTTPLGIGALLMLIFSQNSALHCTPNNSARYAVLLHFANQQQITGKRALLRKYAPTTNQLIAGGFGLATVGAALYWYTRETNAEIEDTQGSQVDVDDDVFYTPRGCMTIDEVRDVTANLLNKVARLRTSQLPGQLPEQTWEHHIARLKCLAYLVDVKIFKIQVLDTPNCLQMLAEIICVCEHVLEALPYVVGREALDLANEVADLVKGAKNNIESQYATHPTQPHYS